MMAKYYPQLSEFRIYTLNQYKHKDQYSDDNHVAVVYYNKLKKLFVIKNRYCLKCSQTSDYFCDPKTKWQF